MAAWQFQFALIPEAGIRRVHGRIVGVLPEYMARIPNASVKDISEFENYWESIEIPSSTLEVLEKLLPERISWSGDARMFGSEDGNSIEVWEDDIDCCVDVRNFDLLFLEALIDIAQKACCKIVLKEGGRVIDPTLVGLMNEVSRSSAAKFVENPSAFISQRS